MSEDHNRALLHRIAEGDESALAALYDKWEERVHTVAFWILGDADEAEDVVEETFWQAWRTAHQYDGRRAAASTWLMMIARSRSLDRLRTRRRRADWTAASATAGALLEQALAGQPDVSSSRANGEEQRSALASALRALPAEQRQVIEMTFFGGMSQAEIAANTSQPLGTVKTRIRLAMGKLRSSLAALHEEGR